MAKSVNKVIILGNVGKDPEVKYSPSGVAVANVGIATNESFKDKEGQWQERTEWHNVTFFGRTAEVLGQYVKKGNKLYIEGKLKNDSWEDKQTGEKKYRTQIICDQMVLLGGRGEGGGSSSSSSSDEYSGGQQQRGSSRGTSAGSGSQGGGAPQEDYAHSTEISDEDIPF